MNYEAASHKKAGVQERIYIVRKGSLGTADAFPVVASRSDERKNVCCSQANEKAKTGSNFGHEKFNSLL